ncbi:MAG: VanZ family protein [Fischerella sp.]|nr:VanZ family protein [Fischerella sp.]
MKKHQISRTTHSLALKDYGLVGVSILVVLLATLYPFNFSFPENFSLQELIGSFINTSTFQDRVNNILLFIPLGFFLSCILQRIRTTLIQEILIVTLTSTSLSTLVEVLQVFLPSRAPTPEDIINNSIGGFVGWLCFNWFSSKSFAYKLASVENNASHQVHKRIAGFCIGYILLTFLTLVYWQSTTSLSNWNPNYPLTIGNEVTGERPWRGYISEIHIADRAISNSEVLQVFDDINYFHNLGDSLLASYQLDQEGKLFYRDESGKQPKLLWQGQPSDAHERKGISLSSSHWLETAYPVNYLSKRISKTSEFTISTTVTTADINQTGPARIISISNDNMRRNFTVGQQGKDLNLRLRTPLTGENGVDLTLNIPNIFVDTKPHHLIITYSRATIQVFVDNLKKSYSLNLLDLIPVEQKIFYYALTFIPLGIYLALLTILTKRNLITYRLLIVFGALLPSLILEALLVSKNGKEISLRNMLLGILFTAGTALILRIRAAVLVKKIVSQ